jgi:hypothetical protein
VSELKGLFDINRAARLVQSGDSYKVSGSILGRDPPPKHHPTRWRGGVGGQDAVRAMIVDELFKVK